MFWKSKEEIQVFSVKKYKVLKHSIVYGIGGYASVVAIRNEQGRLKHIELIDDLYDGVEIENNVIEIKGAYVEVTEYTDGSYETKICI